MNATEYKKLVQGIEEKYLESLKRAEKERMEGLAAVKKVWGMLHKPRSNSKSRRSGEFPEYGSLVETVKKALDYVPKPFTKNHVLMAMKQVDGELASKCNPNSLSGCLIRLEKAGIIIKAKKGKGSTPSEYVKKEDAKDFLPDKENETENNTNELLD